MDQRDKPTWVALELSRAGEMRVEDKTLERVLRRDLDVPEDFPVFIPSMTYKKNGRNVTLHLMEGYAFVGSGMSEVEYFKLEKTAYVNRVMSVKANRGMRVLSVIEDSYVQELREKMQSLLSATIAEGETVRILGGTYGTLEGEVISLKGDAAIVFVPLRSLKAVVSLDKMFLEPATKDEDDE